MLNKNIILHLSLIHDIASGTIQRILDVVDHKQLTDLYHFSAQDFVRFGLPPKKVELLVQGLQDKSLLERELQEIEKYQAEFITVLCDEYPKLLKQIHVPPAVLYYQGDVKLFSQQKMLACVGARKAHGYVQDCLTTIVTPLIEDNWVIVSGGALGADTYAHKAALENNGKTIVVVGSGLCHQYPPKNKKLFDQVVASGGLVVSSFAMQALPEARHFPVRNRIVAGLSVGCLVLQAASKSGALITAHFALEQGREVFAVPGPIYDPLSVGCHDIIKQGAKLTTCSDDLLEELQGFNHQQDSKNIDQKKQQTFITTRPVKKVEQVVADEDERKILQQLVVPISVQDLHAKVAIESNLLHEKLFNLSLDGKVEQDCMGLWKRV